MKVCSTHGFHEFHGVRGGSCGTVGPRRHSWHIVGSTMGVVWDPDGVSWSFIDVIRLCEPLWSCIDLCSAP